MTTALRRRAKTEGPDERGDADDTGVTGSVNSHPLQACRGRLP